MPNQEPALARPFWNWSGKGWFPQAPTPSFPFFPTDLFFFHPFLLTLAPLTAPGSPRMENNMRGKQGEVGPPGIGYQLDSNGNYDVKNGSNNHAGGK